LARGMGALNQSAEGHDGVWSRFRGRASVPALGAGLGDVHTLVRPAQGLRALMPGLRLWSSMRPAVWTMDRS
jgi:hypothetical protein